MIHNIYYWPSYCVSLEPESKFMPELQALKAQADASAKAQHSRTPSLKTARPQSPELQGRSSCPKEHINTRLLQAMTQNLRFFCVCGLWGPCIRPPTARWAAGCSRPTRRSCCWARSPWQPPPMLVSGSLRKSQGLYFGLGHHAAVYMPIWGLC